MAIVSFRELGALNVRRWLLWGVLVTMSLGCSSYGEVSPAAYQYAKALYSVTNRQAADRLPTVVTQIDEAHGRGEISKQEANWLNGIAVDAEEGRWEDANQACRRLMEDQLE